MKTITIKGITGAWNEKTYTSNKSDYRIYVDNKEFHVSKDELNAADSDALKKVAHDKNVEQLKSAYECFVELMSSDLSSKFGGDVICRMLSTLKHELQNEKDGIAKEVLEKNIEELKNFRDFLKTHQRSIEMAMQLAKIVSNKHID